MRPVTALYKGLLGVILLQAGGAFAAPVSLDPTFGSGGRVSLALGSHSSTGRSVIQQADGKYVVAGLTSGASGQRLLLTRFTADGRLDVGFGNAGIVRGIEFSSVETVIQQRDGKIVVAGRRTPWGTILIGRFSSDGTPDPSFGNDGWRSLASNSGAEGLVQQADDKLVVAGLTTDYKMKLVRLHGDGELDSTFGTNGQVIVRRATYGTFPDGVLQQPDGKLLLLGSQNLSDFGSPDSGVVLVRVTADGAFDDSFGRGGVVEIPLRSTTADIGGYVYFTDDVSADLQDDGKIVVVGITVIQGRFKGFLLRLQGDGSLDPSFGSGGIVLKQRALPRAVEVAPDGKLLTLDFTCSGSAYRTCDMTLRRLNQGGRIDVSLGPVKADFSLRREVRYGSPKAMTQLADGSLLIVGDSYPIPSFNGNEFEPDLAITKFRFDTAGFAGLIGLTGATCRCPFNGQPVQFFVRRTGGSKGAVTVDFVTVDGTARAGSDYVSRRGRLHWPDGDTRTKRIELQTLNNPSTAPREFTLRLTNPTGEAILTTGIASVTNVLSTVDDTVAVESTAVVDSEMAH